MGLFNKIFASSNKQPVELLQASITLLRQRVFSELLKKYVSSHGKQHGEFLSDAVLNEVLLEPPRDYEAEKFLRNNSTLIIYESLQLKSDPHIASMLSYLYAAETLLLNFQTKEILSTRFMGLGNKAAELSIRIPTTFDICGNDDAINCIQAIWKYAKKNTGRNK
jgi:hypothetical protein